MLFPFALASCTWYPSVLHCQCRMVNLFPISIIDHHFQPMRVVNSDIQCFVIWIYFASLSVLNTAYNHGLTPSSVGNGQLQIWSIYRFIAKILHRRNLMSSILFPCLLCYDATLFLYIVKTTLIIHFPTINPHRIFEYCISVHTKQLASSPLTLVWMR